MIDLLPLHPCQWPGCEVVKTTQTERWHLEGRKPWLCAAHLADLSTLTYFASLTAQALVEAVTSGSLSPPAPPA